jgi:methionine salvage enolase-phosphatase E1
MKHIQTLENFLNENLNESRIGGVINDLLNKMATNTKLVADVLTIIKLAKEDKEGSAEKAVKLMMDNHGLDEKTATEAVTRIFKSAFEWVK